MRQSSPAETLLDLQHQGATNSFSISREMTYVLIAIAAIAVLLFLWAAYIRKPKRERSSANEIASSSLKLSRRKGRRRSRKFRRRNPTLAETGGLPPRKQECVVSRS